MRTRSWLLLLGFLVALTVRADEPQPLPAPATRPVDFARDIAPLLQANCLRCHGPERPRAGLRLVTRAHALQGSNSGPVLVPGRSADSRLVRVLAGADPDGVVMPPKGPRLTADQIGVVRAWIDQGAAWPDSVILAASATPDNPVPSRHWAWRPLRRPPVPAVRFPSWPRSPVDRFILARLEREGITPAPEADAATLLRRVTLDLIGLPPTPEEIEAFVDDRRPDAYERAVDRLLASPHYGEKWARPWLDLCHYADTDGYLTDQLRPVAWRYRQWLVDALNRDLPFDRFTVEQLAGDLLPNATLDQKIATGFLRNTLSNREGGADLEEYRVEQVVDRTATVATAWLGLTAGCARCHDHKFDPLSQREFFQLYAYFDAADEVNVDAPLPGEWEAFLAKKPEYDRQRAELLRPVEKELAELQRRWERRLLEAADHPGKDHVWDRQWEVLGLIWGGNLGEGQLEGCQIVRTDPTRRTQDQQERLLAYFLQHGSVIDPNRFQALKLGELRGRLEKLKADLPKLSRAPAIAQPPISRRTYLHVRGDFRRRGVEVTPATPSLLPAPPNGTPPNRFGLAQWLTNADNPLPARVTVNRFWQEFFGRGLVFTSDDLGTRGEPPTHPDLLDWLADEFRAGGWRVKEVHRLIVMSAAYRQSSRPRPDLAARDPYNRLLARQASLRLSSEQVRDVTLAVSGLLYRKIGGPCVFPPQPATVAMEGFENKWEPSKGPDRYRRGLYTFRQRLSPFAQEVTFDAPPLSKVCTRRERSNTPLQALTLLNDPVFFEAAQNLAAQVITDPVTDPGERIARVFRRCLGRWPTAAELDRLVRYHRDQAKLLRQESANNDVGAWVGLCSVLLNLHELITRD